MLGVQLPSLPPADDPQIWMGGGMRRHLAAYARWVKLWVRARGPSGWEQGADRLGLMNEDLLPLSATQWHGYERIWMLMCGVWEESERAGADWRCGAAGWSPEFNDGETQLLMGCWKVKWGTGAGLDKREGWGWGNWEPPLQHCKFVFFRFVCVEGKRRI